MEWIISANSKHYDHESSFLEKGYIDWTQGHYNFEPEDIIYIYSGRPIQRINYLTIVERNNMKFSEITDDEKHWVNKEMYMKSQQGKYMRLKLIGYVDEKYLSLEKLQSKGLKAAPQGPVKLSDKANLSTYLKKIFIQKGNLPFEDTHELIEEKKYSHRASPMKEIQLPGKSV